MARLSPFIILLCISGVFAADPSSAAGTAQASASPAAASQPGAQEQPAQPQGLDLNHALEIYAANPSAFQGTDVQKEIASQKSSSKSNKASSSDDSDDDSKRKRQIMQGLDIEKFTKMAESHPEMFQQPAPAAGNTQKSSSSSSQQQQPAPSGMMTRKRGLFPDMSQLDINKYADMVAEDPSVLQAGSQAATGHASKSSSAAASATPSTSASAKETDDSETPAQSQQQAAGPVAQPMNTAQNTVNAATGNVSARKRQLDGVNELVQNISALPAAFSGGQTPGASGTSKSERLAQQQPAAQPQAMPPQQQQQQQQPSSAPAQSNIPVKNLEASPQLSTSQPQRRDDDDEDSEESSETEQKPKSQKQQGLGALGTSLGDTGTQLGGVFGGLKEKRQLGEVFGGLGSSIGTTVGGVFSPAGTNTQAQPSQDDNPHNAHGMEPGVGSLKNKSSKEQESSDEETSSKDRRAFPYPSGDENPRNADQPGAHEPDSPDNYPSPFSNANAQAASEKSGANNVHNANGHEPGPGAIHRRQFPNGDSNPRNADQPGAHDSYPVPYDLPQTGGSDNPRNADQPNAHKPWGARDVIPTGAGRRARFERRKLVDDLKVINEIANQYRYNFSDSTGNQQSSKTTSMDSSDSQDPADQQAAAVQQAEAQRKAAVQQGQEKKPSSSKSQKNDKRQMLSGLLSPDVSKFHGKNANGLPEPTGFQGQDGVSSSSTSESSKQNSSEDSSSSSKSTNKQGEQGGHFNLKPTGSSSKHGEQGGHLKKAKRQSNISDKAFTGVPTPLVPLVKGLSGMQDSQPAPSSSPSSTDSSA